jgi:hypothetical protein
MPIMKAKKVRMDVVTLQPMPSGNDFDISTFMYLYLPKLITFSL